MPQRRFHSKQQDLVSDGEKERKCNNYRHGNQKKSHKTIGYICFQEDFGLLGLGTWCPHFCMFDHLSSAPWHTFCCCQTFFSRTPDKQFTMRMTSSKFEDEWGKTRSSLLAKWPKCIPFNHPHRLRSALISEPVTNKFWQTFSILTYGFCGTSNPGKSQTNSTATQPNLYIPISINTIHMQGGDETVEEITEP